MASTKTPDCTSYGSDYDLACIGCTCALLLMLVVGFAIVVFIGFKKGWLGFNRNLGYQRARSDDENGEHERHLQLETMGTLTKENNKLRRKLRQETIEKDDALNRLSAMMSSRLRDGNADIADLSDGNRPTKLGDRFSELYDNEWTSAYVSLEDFNKQSFSEKDCATVLLDILQECFNVCKATATKQLKMIEHWMTSADSDDGPSDCQSDNKSFRMSSDLLKRIKDEWKDFASKSLTEIQMKTLRALKQHFTGKPWSQALYINSVEKYAHKCTELCWLMAVQDPPMTCCFSIDSNTNLFKPYTRSGPYIDYIVWPAIFVAEGGAIVAKGVAQFTNKRTVSQKKEFSVSLRAEKQSSQAKADIGRLKMQLKNEKDEQKEELNRQTAYQKSQSTEIDRLKKQLQKEKDLKNDALSRCAEYQNIQTSEDKIQLQKEKDENIDELNRRAEKQSSEAKAEIGRLKMQLKIEQDEKKEELNRRTAYQKSQSTEIDRLKKQLQKEKDEKNDALSRDGNAGIAELSDVNRPTKLGERFFELYDNEWTNAYVCLAKAGKQGTSEEEYIKFLFDMFEECFKVSKNTAINQLMMIEHWLTSAVSDADTSDCDRDKRSVRMSNDLLKRVKDERKGFASNSLTELQAKTLDALEQHFSGKRWSTTLPMKPMVTYANQCTEICWLMVVQDPPMSYSFPSNSDTNLYKPYTRSGTDIDYIVWPALFLADGALVAKGVAQFKSMQSKEVKSNPQYMD